MSERRSIAFPRLLGPFGYVALAGYIIAFCGGLIDPRGQFGIEMRWNVVPHFTGEVERENRLVWKVTREARHHLDVVSEELQSAPQCLTPPRVNLVLVKAQDCVLGCKIQRSDGQTTASFR
ncbi:MAG: hypothetical protein Q27BPR15_17010 [Rhodobacter sp. CACIA14H1]|nr:MAG: hypothetical protein Q27BPR15_17010 [Rhodobacter sp. CACIA14H1]